MRDNIPNNKIKKKVVMYNLQMIKPFTKHFDEVQHRIWDILVLCFEI